jgi:hypothetical protein
MKSIPARHTQSRCSQDIRIGPDRNFQSFNVQIAETRLEEDQHLTADFQDVSEGGISSRGSAFPSSDDVSLIPMTKNLTIKTTESKKKKQEELGAPKHAKHKPSQMRYQHYKDF